MMKGNSRLEPLAEANIGPSTKLIPLQDECQQLLAILTTISKKTKTGENKPSINGKLKCPTIS